MPFTRQLTQKRNDSTRHVSILSFIRYYRREYLLVRVQRVSTYYTSGGT